MPPPPEPTIAAAAGLPVHGAVSSFEMVQVHPVWGALIAMACAVVTGGMLWSLRMRVEAIFRTRLMLAGAVVFGSGAVFALALTSIHPAGMVWDIGTIKVATSAAALAVGFLSYRMAPAMWRLTGDREAVEDLETRVKARTGELEALNLQLRGEIAERERIEAEVREANLRLLDRVEDLETLFKVLPVGVAIAEDRACTKVRGNPEMNHLLRLDAGRNMSLSAAAGEAPKHYQVWRHGRLLLPEELPLQTAGRENHEIHDFEETIVHSDGTRHEIICDVVPLRRPDGSVRGVVGVFRDVSELKRTAEERLLIERKMLETHKTQSIGRLAAGVAHDFNNLLAVIKGAVELARVEPGVPEPAVRRLGTVDFAIRRASDLCQQMLSYAGQGRLTLQKVDVNECVQQAVGLVRSSFPRGRDVVLELDSKVGTIESDPSQMVQVVVNLFTNALEASERTGAPVRISTSIVEIEEKDLSSIQPPESLVPGRCVMICVKDVGLGMDAVTLRQLFTPFFSTKFQGRGLGLAAVLGVARSHRGGVRVWSQPNRGTRVEVFFPVGQAREAIAAPAPAPAAGGAKRPRRVLVVDDEAMIRRVIASLLQSQNFEAETAGGGREALEMIESADYGLVVLDAAMPEMDGFETMRRLKLLRPDLAVVVISGSSKDEIATRFSPLNPEAILHKPFEFSELHGVLDRIFGTWE